jgi:hypothetical protein
MKGNRSAIHFLDYSLVAGNRQYDIPDSKHLFPHDD